MTRDDDFARFAHHGLRWQHLVLGSASRRDDLGRGGCTRVRITQRGELPPGGHEGLLGGGFRLLHVPEDETRDGVVPADRAACQLRERVSIARHRSFHGVPMHRASDCMATWVVALGVDVRSRGQSAPDSSTASPG